MSLSSALRLPPNPSQSELQAWREVVTALLEKSIVGTIVTQNNTPTELMRFNPRPQRTTFCKLVVVARRIGGSAGSANDGATYIIYSGWTVKAGVATLLGATHTPTYQFEDQAGWQAEVVIANNRPILRVTGATNNIIRWAGKAEFFSTGI